MHIWYDPAGVAGAAARLAAGSDAAHAVAAAMPGLAAGVSDASLRDALGTLGNVCADALDVVALDLDLLAGMVDVGASRYESVEAGLSHVGGQTDLPP